MVVPGPYSVELTCDGQTVDQSFEILPDPRLLTTADDWQAQRDFLLDVLDRLAETNRTIDAIDGLLAQIAIWKSRTQETAVQDAATACEIQLQEMRSALIDVHMKGSQLWPSGLHEKFNALLDSVDGADYAPPQQARDVFAELGHQLAEITSRLKQMPNKELATLNRAIAEAGLPIIGVTA
jgi:hypothetical protein